MAQDTLTPGDGSFHPLLPGIESSSGVLSGAFHREPQKRRGRRAGVQVKLRLLWKQGLVGKQCRAFLEGEFSSKSLLGYSGPGYMRLLFQEGSSRLFCYLAFCPLNEAHMPRDSLDLVFTLDLNIDSIYSKVISFFLITILMF